MDTQHEHLSHLGEIKAHRAAHGGVHHLRNHGHRRHRHHRHARPSNSAGTGAGAPLQDWDSDSSSSDEEAFGKLSVLTANSHYLPRLYVHIGVLCAVRGGMVGVVRDAHLACVVLCVVLWLCVWLCVW